MSVGVVPSLSSEQGIDEPQGQREGGGLHSGGVSVGGEGEVVMSETGEEERW